MPTPDQLQLRSLRKLYAKAHQQLQDAGMRIIRLEDRVRDLETEIAELRSAAPYSHGASNAN